METSDLTRDPDIINIVDRIADIYRKNLANAGTDKQGELYNFRQTINMKGEIFEINFNLPDYWIYAENGRRPGKQPPLNEILKWIRIKHLVPRAYKGKVPSTKGLAFMIARKIGKKGTRGNHLLQKTLTAPQTRSLIEQLKDAIADTYYNEIMKSRGDLSLR